MSLRHDLCQRLSAIGLRQELVHNLVDDIVKWHRSNGPEWTVARLKEGKLYYLHRLAGKEYTPSIWQRKNQNGPTGSLGALLRLYGSQPAKVLNALNGASLFLAPSATAKQLKKFKESVCTGQSDYDRACRGEDPRFPFQVTGFRVASEAARRAGVVTPSIPGLQIRPPRLWSDHSWSSEKRAPLSDGSTVPETEAHVWIDDNLRSLVGTLERIVGSTSLLAKAGFPVSRNEDFRKPTFTGGHVAFIQEPGFKLRAVANPYRLWQVLTDGLKQTLFSKLRAIPEDCTYDQEKGVNAIRGWLEDGRETIYSVDLSDATNRAPLSEQLSLIRDWFDLRPAHAREQVDLVMGISRATWKMPDGKPISWDKGQPLGLGPSFAMFALWHNKVLHALRKEHGGDYVVLGDDVAIRGAGLHEAYRAYLRSRSMPVSQQKCIESKKLAEFAGKVVTPEAVYSVAKWRRVSDFNFVDVARSLGPQSLPMFRPRQREVLKVLSVVPEFLGGLGWNSKGLPFKDRLELALSLGLLDEKPEQVPFHSSSHLHVATLQKMAYEGQRTLVGNDLRPARPTRSRYHDLQAQLGITEGETLSTFLGGDHVGGNLSSDPRGAGQLARLEKMIKSHSRRTQVVPDTVGSESPKC